MELQPQSSRFHRGYKFQQAILSSFGYIWEIEKLLYLPQSHTFSGQNLFETHFAKSGLNSRLYLQKVIICNVLSFEVTRPHLSKDQMNFSWKCVCSDQWPVVVIFTWNSRSLIQSDRSMIRIVLRRVLVLASSLNKNGDKFTVYSKFQKLLDTLR